jgi:hypothetical protein
VQAGKQAGRQAGWAGMCRLTGCTSLVLREVEDEQLCVDCPKALGEALQAGAMRAVAAMRLRTPTVQRRQCKQ